MTNYTTKQKQALLDRAATSLSDQIFEEIATHLNDSDVKRLEELSQLDSTGGLVKQFLSEKIPNLDSITDQTIVDFKKEVKAQLG